MSEEVMGFDKLDAYVKGYNSGRAYERALILRLANEASVSNDIGDYVYLSDLNDYIEEADLEDA